MKKSLLVTILFFSVFSLYAQHPVNLTSSNVTSNSVELSWTDNGCNTFYKLRYREAGGSWQPSNSGIPNVTSPYSLNNLNPNTSYEWTVKCNGTGGWANPIQSFNTTTGCNLISSISVSNASCNNTLDGSAILNISNGTPPYTFNWDNGTTSQNLIGTGEGTYIVQITDDNGCTTSDTAIIGSNGNQSINQQLSQFSPNPVTAYHQWSYDTLRITNTGCDVRIRPEFVINCNAGPIQQGDIVIKWQNPLGFNQNINYNIDANGNAYGFWSFTSGDSSGTDITFGQIQDVVIQVKFVNPAQFGAYNATWETFKVDNFGNKLGTLAGPNTVSLSLIDCSTLSIDGFSSTNPNCVGSADGTINVNNVSNGSGNFSFNWSNGSTQANITSLVAGTYVLSVTDNNSGCSTTDSVTLVDPSPLSGTLTGTNISCNGLSDGTLLAIASGGSSSYKYTWTPSVGQNSNITNLSAGTYNLTIIDLVCNNSISGLSYTITEPALLTYSSFNTNNTSCDNSICNGSFGMILSGGTTPYSYTWTNGDTTNSQTNLCSGNYSITATDANSCNSFTENVIVYDSSLTPSTSIISTNISCYGLNDGSAEVMISSGGNSTGGNISTLNYCSSSPGTNNYSNIEMVRIIGDNDSISNNTSGTCDTYEDYTTQFTTLTPGNNYNLEIVTGSCVSGQYNIDSVAVYIDWNIDGDFNDAGEKISSFGGIISPINEIISFVVPNIGYGATRMRIISHAQFNNAGFPNGPVNPCVVGDFGQNGTYSQPWYGSTEDYSIVVNGTVPATYFWSTGDTTASLSNLSSGIYTVTVTDTNNCSSVDSIIITEPSNISTVENVNNISCNGNADGSVSLSISGGTPGYIEDWGINNPDSLSAGTYNYTIFDTNGCTFNSSITITEPNELSISSSNISNILCNGDATGSVDITLIGGTSSYSYLWSNGDTTEDLSNVSAGVYYLQVTDVNACILLDTFVITEPTAITATNIITDVSCNGLSDGSVSLSISGGTPGYTEDWGSFNSSSLSAGTYNYTVTDANACIYTNSVIINEPNIISTTTLVSNVSCNGGSDGSVSLTISGGTPGYTEDWGNNDPNMLSAGTYDFYITDTNGCSDTNTIIISEPQVLNASYTQTNVSCNGLADGTALVNITGGTQDYILSWDTLNYPLLGGINVFSTPIGVPAGVYPFGITDNNGCTFTDIITITEPPAIIVNETILNVSCNGFSDGSVTLSISGGTPGYSEDWGTNNPNSLFAGTYNYLVTDTNGCLYNNSVTITEPNVLTSTLIPTDLTSCLVSNGSIDLIVSGGTSPYSYLWNNTNADTTQDLSNLSAGNYSVNITDNNGCNINNNVTVNQPSNGLSLTLTSSNYSGNEISCFGGSDGTIITNTSGGLGNLTFLWTGPNGYNSTSSQISNLYAGSYSVTMTDSVGCSLFENIILNQPQELNATTSQINVSCYGGIDGSAQVFVFGGTTDYLLSWDTLSYPLVGNVFITPIGVPAGIYPYAIIDNNGCTFTDTITITEPSDISSSYTVTNYNGYNVSCNGSADASINILWSGGTPPYQNWFNGTFTNDSVQNNLSSGTYIDSLIDDNGCTFSSTIIITEPNEIFVNETITNSSCNGLSDGSVSLSIFGGTPGYTEDWGTNNPNSLSAGTYNYTISDTNGCIYNDSVTITEPSEIIIDIDSIVDVDVYNGNNGKIYITVNGGSSNYSYVWNGPNGYNSNNEDILGLYSGNYFLVVTDSTNCSKTDTVYVDQPSSLSINLDTIVNLLCFEQCTGQINITPSGGDSSYTYLWNGPNGFTSSSEDLNNLCAGNYELILSDSSSSVTSTFTINQPAQLQTITNADTAICYGGLAQASAFSYGGQAPYITSWDIGSSSIITFLSAGVHYVNVIDANGCTATDSVLIVQNDSITLNSISTPVSCYGLTDGIIEINHISGGTPPFQYSNNNGLSFQNSNIFSNLSPGLNNFTVSDANGCENSISDIINEPSELVITLSSIPVSCFDDCDGTIISSVNGGLAPYTYSLDGNSFQNSNTFDNLCAGLHNIIVKDNNNCLSTNSTIISEPAPVIVTISVNGIYLEATTGFVSYQWLDDNGSFILGANSQNYLPSNVGEYSVEVTDQNGCTGTSNTINYIIESLNSESTILSIYPNPTSNWITIETQENIKNDINIINVIGETVYTISKDKFSDNYEMINLSNLPKGSYIIQLINSQSIINHKIILR